MIRGYPIHPSDPTVPTARKPTDDAPAADAAAPFQAIRSARAFEDIAAQIRAELAAGRLKVGSRLPSERALSEQFNVSRNTLREALRSLEHAGLISRSRDAQRRPCKLEAAPLAEATGWLIEYRKFWEKQFGQLDDLLDELKRLEAMAGKN